MATKQVIFATRVWTDFDEADCLRMFLAVPKPCPVGPLRVCLDEVHGIEADFEKIVTLDDEVLFRSTGMRPAHDRLPVLPLLVQQGRSLFEKGC